MGRAGRWKFTWNWPAPLPGRQMFILEPGWGLLQAAGGRHFEKISGFLLALGRAFHFGGRLASSIPPTTASSPTVANVPGLRNWLLSPRHGHHRELPAPSAGSVGPLQAPAASSLAPGHPHVWSTRVQSCVLWQVGLCSASDPAGSLPRLCRRPALDVN